MKDRRGEGSAARSRPTSTRHSKSFLSLSGPTRDVPVSPNAATRPERGPAAGSSESDGSRARPLSGGRSARQRGSSGPGPGPCGDQGGRLVSDLRLAAPGARPRVRRHRDPWPGGAGLKRKTNSGTGPLFAVGCFAVRSTRVTTSRRLLGAARAAVRSRGRSTSPSVSCAARR